MFLSFYKIGERQWFLNYFFKESPLSSVNYRLHSLDTATTANLPNPRSLVCPWDVGLRPGGGSRGGDPGPASCGGAAGSCVSSSKHLNSLNFPIETLTQYLCVVERMYLSYFSSTLWAKWAFVDRSGTPKTRQNIVSMQNTFQIPMVNLKRNCAPSMEGC